MYGNWWAWLRIFAAMAGIPAKFFCTLLLFFAALHLNAGEYRSADAFGRENSTNGSFREHRHGGGELHRINPHTDILCTSISRVHFQAALTQPVEDGICRNPVIDRSFGYPGFFHVRNCLSHLYPSHYFW